MSSAAIFEKIEEIQEKKHTAAEIAKLKSMQLCPEPETEDVEPGPSAVAEISENTKPHEELEHISADKTVDVLLVTTDDEEFTLAHEILKGRQIVADNGPNQGQLCLGEIGKNKIALLKASPRETVRVDVLCAKTIQNLEPKAIVSVGVCSGTKENVHHLRDVLISSQVDFYNPVGEKSPKLAVHDCNLALITLFDQAGWYGPKPGVVDPERHVGQIVCAAQDMSNTAYKDEVGLLYPDAIGVDKQSGGLFASCKTSGVPWLSCKAITAWISGRENSGSHSSGAEVSISYVEHVLKKCYIPEKLKEFEKAIPKTVLPDMVPNFTGRDSECKEIVHSLTSKTKRIVTISGPPGFGKTSVAKAVCHHLKRQGLAVYYLSLIDVKSSKDFESELVNSFPPKAGDKRPPKSIDQVCRVLSGIPADVSIVLDNADYLFEQQTSHEVLNLLRKILDHCENVNLLCITRMNLDIVLRNSIQDYVSITIVPLDADSSAKLVKELLPEANASECSTIAKMSGHVPLAIKLFCGSIKDDGKNPTQFLDEFHHSSQNVFDLLDDPDLPSDERLKNVFDSSFVGLSQVEQEAFVSLSVFVGETFDEKAAVNIIDGAKTQARIALRGLKRKCLIASTKSTEENILSFHPLIKSFAVEKAKCDMKEVGRQAQIRFLRHYVQLCKDLNEEFLAGDSLTTFLKFEFDKKVILHCLVQGLSSKNVGEDILDVLAAADLFLDTMFYFGYALDYDDVYKLAVEKAKERRDVVATHQLLLGRLLFFISSSNKNRRQKANDLFDEAKKIEDENRLLISEEAKGKRMCYQGMFLLLSPDKDCTALAVETLERGINLLSSRNTMMLKALSSQVLAVYFRYIRNVEKSSHFHELAITICEDRRYLQAFLLFINEVGCLEAMETEFQATRSQPALVLAFTLLIGCLGRRYDMTDTLERLAVVVSEMEKDTEEKAKQDSSYFPMLYYICRTLLKLRKPEKAYSALESALENARAEYGEEHEQTAKILYSMAIEKSKVKDHHSALCLYRQALKIREKLGGKVVSSYHKIGLTLTELKDYQGALQAHEKALRLSLELVRKQNPVGI
ncbi:WD repeat-containing alr2800 [Paramuricea clavata]|uniref:WD repeat-containing alr2800 n=1 Tax=Paramuricea clavata TaxID=317549 RepID=A0A7D9HRI9_PARCT|nr:WD repeat-containing alr2800 [Paramuricea clavata]